MIDSRVSRGRAIVSDNSNLERDMASQAIINRNETDYIRRLAVKQETRANRAELDNLKSEVQELKDLVKSLLSSQKNNST